MLKPRLSSTQLAKMRRQKVVKANELIQKRTHMLSVQEQKIILYLTSQLKPEQQDFEYQEFQIADFCDICGIDHTSGKNYADLKAAIKTLSDRSMWVAGEGKETLMRWICKAEIVDGSGNIGIMIDPDMKPFLLELKNRYTQFDLIYTLGMKSKYSVRLYEILKSYEKIAEPVEFSLERFRELIGAEYKRWVDIKRRALEPAIKEINRLSDLSVIFEPKLKGRAVVGVSFLVRLKRGFTEQTETYREIYRTLGHETPENIAQINK